ncbi:MAG: hypothetical protein HOK21_07895 [Rhodospirillaceae bacterium]|jgi:hypothetical protein|nr:hypothetical protein [Rhodospirillaceae bacterium]MBT5082473.1 hypothetical protein [Rhodospirillaceae bacterium]MBT5523990.1 hypothetical protein [Rhodospirillaceae bacterium]MBT5882547.1 hypothetical protein [Rhodospirillaceae bacterium]MBT6588141.1 hypothetical protein [Rhodospirillaceae bacterium]
MFHRYLPFLISVVVVGAIASTAMSAEEEHLRLNAPGALPPAKAQAIYQAIQKDMTVGYAPSKDAIALSYPKWRRFNIAPYLSATHGNRYANNFANAKAATGGYGDLKPGETLPPGAAVVKDSFTVTKEGEVYPGAVFYMEKLSPGRSPATGDWRFVQILPDGSFIGDTTGDSPEDVAFCFTCHQAMAEVDYLFFLPDDYRRK